MSMGRLRAAFCFFGNEARRADIGKARQKTDKVGIRLVHDKAHCSACRIDSRFLAVECHNNKFGAVVA